MVYTLAEPKNWSWALMTKALSLGEGKEGGYYGEGPKESTSTSSNSFEVH